MLRLTYSPNICAAAVADRRWSTDLYQVVDQTDQTGRISYTFAGRFGLRLSLRPTCLFTLPAAVAELRCLHWHPSTLPAAAEEYEAAARARHIGTATVTSLLRDPRGRDLCRQCAAAGRAYSADAEYWAPRRIVRQAVALLGERLARREAAQRQAPESGRILRLARELAAARAEQRRKRVEELVLTAAKGLYRRAGAGDHSARVTLGDVPRASGVGSKGDRYSSRCTFRKTNSRHSYTVRETWEQDVYDRDIEVCDGLLTLDAEPIQGHGPELYRAVWVEQGRGMTLNTVRGYIARLEHDGRTYTYHGPSARAALDGVQRKARLKPARRQGTVDLDRLVRRHGDLPVRWGDHEGIACDSGTRSWCEAVGIDVECGCTVADVVAGYRLRPHQEALQIVRRVVRDRRNRGPIDLSLPESALEQQGRVVFDSEGGFRIVPPDSAN